MRTEGEINTRAKKAVRIFGLVFMAAFAVAGIWQAFGIDGYRKLGVSSYAVKNNRKENN
jgi:cytochrome d ubiquinol oxidase subunit II